MRRRVVVTGLGAVTPLAVGAQRSWAALLAGRSGVVSLAELTCARTGLAWAQLPATVAATVKRGPGAGEFDAARLLTATELRTTTPFIQYALVAAAEALADAGWAPGSDDERRRAGACIGSGVGSIDEIYTTSLALRDGGWRRVGPYFVPKVLANLAAGHVSIKHGLQGPNHSVSTACATGTHAIGDAMRFIQYGDADVMLAGGSEASVSPVAMAGFCRAKSLSTAFNDTPERASRPFDKDRDGFVIGEGAGVLVLEELSHAQNRGARIYAEIKGYGLSADANHITAPTRDGDGAFHVMKRALEVAGLPPTSVDYINTHATGTAIGDSAENAAIKRFFGEHAKELAVSSNKGQIGHLLGAAGAVEAIFTVLAIQNNIAPPTLNLDEVSSAEEFNLNYVPQTPQERRIDTAISNSFGFGGLNAALVFAKYGG